jgi:predicted peptidase
MAATAAALAVTLAAGHAAPDVQTAARIETGFLDRVLAFDGKSIRYQVYVPAEYRPERTWPLVVHLHGGGPQGTDGLSHTMRISEQILIDRSRFPLLVLNPQAQPGRRWLDPDMQEMVVAQIDRTLEEFTVDPARVYLSGFSMGAAGVYGMAYRWPERFAALVAIAGRVEAASGTSQAVRRVNRFLEAPDPFGALAERIRDVPLWLFHGAADEGMSVGQSRRLAEAMKEAGGTVKYTEYRGTNHDDSGFRALSDPELMRWLLAQHRQR